MGLNDHLEDGTGCILSLGLDLNYLHVEGGRHATQSATAGHLGPPQAGEEEAGAAGCGNGSSGSNSRSSSTSSSLSISSISISSNCSEESAVSDSDDERVQRRFPVPLQNPSAQNISPRDSPPPTTMPSQPPATAKPVASADPLSDYRAKVDFALKLGYPEELVLLVLRKLGPNALINDILGELVKLGTKTEMEQQVGVLGGGGLGGGGGPTAYQSSSFSAHSSSSSSRSSSTSSLDSCRLLCPSRLLEDKENLRPVVLDGSNVAMSHGNKEVFSCQGIQLAVDWFLERGHSDITVFVPAWRKEQSRPDALITDQEILRRLEKEKILVFTPSRRVQGRRVVCYDDRFIVKLAYESDGIIVSNDNYRDLANEKPEWKKFIDERLLMYSFVNDKFMPPDDPLGRHGPSLENFLRKRPIIPEHRKQPCPYGRKCTYGHKCKFYHPERGNQPLRAVADELRASVKSSSSAKSLLGDTLIIKSLHLPKGQTDGMLVETDLARGPSKKKLDSGLHSDCFSDFLEDRLGVRAKADTRRGSSSSSSSCSSSIVLGHLAPGGPTGSQDRWDQPRGGDGGTTRVVGASGPGRTDTYPTCESPELDYSCLMRAYSSLSLVVPQSPERFFPADLRAGSLASDCSSEGSVSSDSFSPDPLDDRIKCHRHHRPTHSHHHHHCPKRCSHPPASHSAPSVGLHPPHSYPLPQTLRRLPGFGSEEPPSSYPPHPSHPFKPPLFYLPLHPQHSSLSSRAGCPRDYPAPPPTLPQTSPLGHSLLASPWQESRPQDSRLYEGSPLHARRDYAGLNQHHQQQQQHLSGWEAQYQQPPKPFLCQSLPEGRDEGWHSPWGRDGHLSPRGLSTSQHPHTSLPLSHSAHSNNHPPVAPQHQESPTLGRYQDLRENVFVNLCNIFPPDLVRVVMGRNPHVTDAQQLAAAILMEKSQQGY